MCSLGTESSRRRETQRSDTVSIHSEFRQAFEVLDSDHDGKISREDLHKFYKQFNINSTNFDSDNIIGTMMSVADSNKDGFVEYDDFERVLNRKNSSPPPTGTLIMRDVFNVMDKDGDGFLSHGDLKSFMDLASFSSSDEDVSVMIKLAGGDGGCDGGGGCVSFEGLLKILGV